MRHPWPKKHQKGVVCRAEEDGSNKLCNQCSNYWGESSLVLDVGDSGLWGNPGEVKIPGECCTGFMDYGDHANYWSECNVRDFETAYIKHKWDSCLGNKTDCENNII